MFTDYFRNDFLKKPLLTVASLLFLLLGLASVILYRERVLYVDSAYYAFQFINQGYPAAEHNRYALWLYQLIPWAMLKADLSVPAILRAYSLSPYLVHALVFFLLVRMRQNGLATLLALMQVLSYRECFFLTVNETALAISATLMLAGCMEYFGSRTERPSGLHSYLKQGTVYFICILTALYSHPTAMLMIPFVIVYHFIRNRGSIGWKTITAIAAAELIIVAVIKLTGGRKSGYEDDLFSQLGRTGEILSGLSDVYSFHFFFGDLRLNSPFFGIYVIPLLLSAVALTFLLREKRYLLTLFCLLSSCGLWLLTAVMFNRGDGTIFMEKNFTPWVLVALYPLSFTGFVLKGKAAAAGVFLCLVLFSLYGISEKRPMYSKRLWLMDRLITEKNPQGAPKLLLQDSTVNHEEWLGVWALPYETLLLSRVKNIPNVTAKIYRNEEHINRELHRPDIFLGADFIPVLPDTVLLNQEYFSLKREAYREVSVK